MPETLTTRFGLHNYSADTDAFPGFRADTSDNVTKLDALAVKFTIGPIASRPAPAAANIGTAWITDTGSITWSTGSAWLTHDQGFIDVRDFVAPGSLGGPLPVGGYSTAQLNLWTAGMNAALAAARAAGQKLYVPSGTYWFNAGIDFSGVDVFGDGFTRTFLYVAPTIAGPGIYSAASDFRSCSLTDLSVSVGDNWTAATTPIVLNFGNQRGGARIVRCRITGTVGTALVKVDPVFAGAPGLPYSAFAGPWVFEDSQFLQLSTAGNNIALVGSDVVRIDRCIVTGGAAGISGLSGGTLGRVIIDGTAISGSSLFAVTWSTPAPLLMQNCVIGSAKILAVNNTTTAAVTLRDCIQTASQAGAIDWNANVVAGSLTFASVQFGFNAGLVSTIVFGAVTKTVALITIGSSGVADPTVGAATNPFVNITSGTISQKHIAWVRLDPTSGLPVAVVNV